ncbi:ABC transporter ATP-binding protein [Duganella sp. CT11-25]|uniref:ABC transporter ATP-binding protein n=1 Tax=unclassified Duganella TaxID=2636909 RepID=UPI0039AEDAE3
MLNLKSIKKLYRAGDVLTAALRDVNLEIARGDYVAITGPSGCGKSTLLNILGLLDVPDEGRYEFDGRAVEGLNERQLNELRRGRVGFIFQSFNLIEELTVAENVGLALEYSGAPDQRERVAQMLDKLGMAHRAGHYPSQLSGGQQQRVAIARALVARPLLLLADEPTGNLDQAHGEEVMALLKNINDEGTTVVMVTHSVEHAAQAGRTVHMLDGSILSDEVRQAA